MQTLENVVIYYSYVTIENIFQWMGICFAALIVFSIVIGIVGGGTDSTKETPEEQAEKSTKAERENGKADYVAMVQSGYFGEFTDATVKDILDMNFDLSGFTLDWISSDMDGKEYVAFYSK